jgi:hypothetical protein
MCISALFLRQLCKNVSPSPEIFAGCMRILDNWDFAVYRYYDHYINKCICVVFNKQNTLRIGSTCSVNLPLYQINMKYTVESLSNISQFQFCQYLVIHIMLDFLHQDFSQ